MDLFTSSNATIISFPPFSGSKFLSNCLSLSSKACPQDPETATHLLLDPYDYAYRLERVLSTLPSKDNMSAWRTYEFGDRQLYGDAFRCWSTGQIGQINPVTEQLAKSDMKFFIGDHSMEPLGLISVWTRSTTIRFVNSRRFQDLCLSKKSQSLDTVTPINGNYCREKYDLIRGPDWPHWADFDSQGYDIRLFSDVDPDILVEISKFYRVHLIQNPVILFDVDLCYFNRDKFMESVSLLYQKLHLPDFQPDLIGLCYDRYAQLHF